LYLRATRGFNLDALSAGYIPVTNPIIVEKIRTNKINRESGSSKMSGGIMSEALMGVIHMKISSIRANYNKHISN
jgi:hypothetical protein